MPDNAALYSPGDPPSVDFFTAWDGVMEAKVTQGDEERPQQYRVRMGRVVITINVMPEPEIEEHIQGFADYVRFLHQSTPSARTDGLIDRIGKIRTALGCVIEPGFDEEGVVEGLIDGLARELDALVFAADSVFDSDGKPLVGPAAEPQS